MLQPRLDSGSPWLWPEHETRPWFLHGALFYAHNRYSNTLHMFYLLSYSQFSLDKTFPLTFPLFFFYHFPIYIFFLLFLKWLQNVNYLMTLVTAGHTILKKINVSHNVCHLKILADSMEMQWGFTYVLFISLLVSEAVNFPHELLLLFTSFYRNSTVPLTTCYVDSRYWIQLSVVLLHTYFKY